MFESYTSLSLPLVLSDLSIGFLSPDNLETFRLQHENLSCHTWAYLAEVAWTIVVDKGTNEQEGMYKRAYDAQ